MQLMNKIKKGMLGAGLLVVSAVSTTIVLSLLFLASPNSIGPAGVTIWFVLLLAALTSSLMLLLLANKKRRGKLITPAEFKATFKLALVPAAAVTLVLALSSLGSLGAVDLLLIAGVTLVVGVYFFTTDRRQTL